MTRIVDAGLDAIQIALDPLPETAPPVIAYQPDKLTLKHDQILLIQRELERAAIALYPRWLPEAAEVTAMQGAGVAAVRAAASRRAKNSHQFGPFLADLAEAGLKRDHVVGGSGAPAHRSSGAAWAIANSYGRQYAALLIDLPDELTSSDEMRLTTAADWFVGNSGLAVWLTGASLATVDKYITASVGLESLVEERTGPLFLAPLTLPQTHLPSIDVGPLIEIPPMAGYPRADSQAECALERALAKREWASGRYWNQTYQGNPLSRPFRLDLWWKAERFVVEVDGPEHHRPLRYAADRRRDVQLQLDGHAVLRYTNDQVLGDLDRVVSEIERLVRRRRIELNRK